MTGIEWRELFDVLRDLWPILAVLVLVAVAVPWVEQSMVLLRTRLRQPAGGEVIRSPQRSYELAGVWSSGDVCDVVLAASGSDQFLLKIPRHAGNTDLLINERDFLWSITTGRDSNHVRPYLPRLVESFRRDSRHVNVFAFREGLYSAEEIRLSHPQGVDRQHLGWMFNRTLEVLGYVHRRGWLHGAVLPTHLLFDVANHGLVLVDWIHARRIGKPLAIVPEQFKPWYPPECHRREPASEATDIFLAARSLIDLAGGDPLAGTLPPHIPHEMTELLGRCLHPAPHIRSRDAWRLRDEWGELLRRLYGPPQFHVLAMH